MDMWIYEYNYTANIILYFILVANYAILGLSFL